MNFFLLLTFSLLSFQPLNAQINSIKKQRQSYTKNELDNLLVFHFVQLQFNAESARNHIDSNTIYLLFDDNCAGLINFENSQDSAFQKKYHVCFCLAPSFGNQENDFNAYNATIIAYLDKKYRKKWRNEIRKGAIGLK